MTEGPENRLHRRERPIPQQGEEMSDERYETFPVEPAPASPVPDITPCSACGHPVSWHIEGSCTARSDTPDYCECDTIEFPAASPVPETPRMEGFHAYLVEWLLERRLDGDEPRVMREIATHLRSLSTGEVVTVSRNELKMARARIAEYTAYHPHPTLELILAVLDCWLGETGK